MSRENGNIYFSIVKLHHAGHVTKGSDGLKDSKLSLTGNSQVCHHFNKFADQKYYVTRDIMVYVCHVISQVLW